MRVSQVFVDEDELISLLDGKVDDTRLLKPDGHVHVIPRKSFCNHIDSAACGCRPVWDEQNRSEYAAGYAEVQVWVHKSDKELKQ